MNDIVYFLNNDGNVVIEATFNNVTYAVVITPRIIAGKAYIAASSIDTTGCDNPNDIKMSIISHITTQRGKNNEAPLVVEKNK